MISFLSTDRKEIYKEEIRKEMLANEKTKLFVDMFV